MGIGFAWRKGGGKKRSDEMSYVSQMGLGKWQGGESGCFRRSQSETCIGEV